MDENTSKSLHLGAAVLLSILIIGMGVNFYLKGKTLFNLSSQNIDQVTNSVSKSNYTQYDNTTVSGSQVINAISLLATNQFSIAVKTTSDSTGITYNSPTGYKITDLANADYIEPTANFKSQIVKNANKTVTKILFSPLNGSSGSSFGSAQPGQVLNGQTFTNNDGHQTGNMVDNTGKGIVINPGTSDQAVPGGYTDGNANSIKITGDPNLISSNIISGKTIFGVTGNAANGKRWSSGTITSTNGTFSVTGLAFKPSIFIAIYIGGYNDTYGYIGEGFSYNSSVNASMGLLTYGYTIPGNGCPVTVTSSSISFNYSPTYWGGTYKWFACE